MRTAEINDGKDEEAAIVVLEKKPPNIQTIMDQELMKGDTVIKIPNAVQGTDSAPIRSGVASVPERTSQ